MYEIERKYLAKPTIEAFIDTNRLHEHKIEQFYTHIDADKSIRYRKMDDRYYKTVKKGSGAIREEYEKEIPKKQYKKMKKQHRGKIIKKRRYLWNHEGLHYDIDLYQGTLSGLQTLEVEFPNETAYRDYRVPKAIEHFLLDEVTKNEAYKNRSLALQGIPSAHYTDQILSVMCELPPEHLERLRIGDIDTIDALRVILYKYALLILHYESKILQEDQHEDLHQFRVNLRRSRGLIKSFKSYFPSSWYTDVYEALNTIAAETNHARDLDVMLTQHKDKNRSAAYHEILQERLKEREKIIAKLQSESFKRFFNEYLSSLRSGQLRDKTLRHLPLGKSARKVIRRLHKKILRKIAKEERHFDPKVIHNIRISFKTLRYLLEDFEALFGKKSVTRVLKKVKKLQTLLGEYNDKINQIRLLKAYRKKDPRSNTSKKKKERKLLKKSTDKLLKKVLKQLHRFKKERLEL